MQFYILMIDYGKGPHGPMGFEAVCQPELTRRAIVEQARGILAEDRHSIAFVKFIDGNFCEDVTGEILAEAKEDRESTLASALKTSLSRLARDYAKETVA